MSGAETVLMAACAVACGLVGGVFFAFSAFVMAGLGRLPAAHGAAAMQAINVAAITPAFMTALIGTAAACGVAAVVALAGSDGGWSLLASVAAVLYLGSAIGLTRAYHVPRNERLAALTGADATAYWDRYRRDWVAANHLRAAGPLVAAALFAAALASG
jgi:uncharacterized membrane protein